jgi:hypothetical protein
MREPASHGSGFPELSFVQAVIEPIFLDQFFMSAHFGNATIVYDQN